MNRDSVYLICLVLLLGWSGPVAWGQANQIQNAEFDSGVTSWGTYGGAGFTVGVVTGAHLSGANAALINVTDPSVASIGISQGGLKFEKGRTYPVGVTAKADKEREMVILIQLYKPEGPSWTDIVLEHVSLTTKPQTFLFEYTHDDDSMADHPDWAATIYLMLKGQWWAMTGDTVASKVWVDCVHVGEQPPLVDSTVRNAYAPVPADGSTVDQVAAVLEWRPGDFAVSHNVYFGEDANAVRAGSVEPAATAMARFIVGFLPPYPTGLTPGQTYYWRVDEVNDVNPEGPWKGDVWNFLVRPLTAWKPVPADGSKFVEPDQDLAWETGANALFHTVYLGESAEEAATATAGGWMGVDPQRQLDPLQPSKTYYWRVDEFDGMSTYTGSVWSFITAAPGGGLKAEYFNNADLSGVPAVTRTDAHIDFTWGSGSVAGQNSPDKSINVDNFSARWTGEVNVDLTDTYVFSITADNGFRLWFDGRLVIDYWDNPATDTRQSGPIPLTAGQTYSLRMEYYEGTDAALAQLFWQSAVQNKQNARAREIVPSGALGPPLKAHSPQPANGATDTVRSLDLEWTAGDQAIRHHLYFGTDPEAVANADPTTAGIYRGGQTATTYNPGALDWGRTYYWRVDEEEADGTLRKGSLWTFATVDFIVVDDFESYTDEEGNRIFDIWIDGWTNNNGSTVGNTQPPFAEQKIVHGGVQSMPLDYNNVNAPFYSEAEREFSPVQDWTLNETDTLVLYVRGRAANGAAPLYLAVEDASQHVGVVVHPDPAVITAAKWTEWKVPFSELAGVNMARVKKMYIGLGDRDAPTKGGAGRIYIDDIRVIRAKP